MKKIGQFLSKAFAWAKNILGKNYEFMRHNSHLAVAVTSGLKGFIESPVADFVTALIPGEADDIAKAKLRIVLPKVAQTVALAHGIIQQSTAQHEVVAGIVAYVRTLNPDGRAIFWVNFAAQVNLSLADGKVSFSEAVAMAQLVFAEINEKK